MRGRDTDLKYIRARKDHRCYGMGLGIMLVDDIYPGFPGDVRNASAYPFPIQYELVRGVDIPSLVVAEDKSPCLPPILEAAHNLERMGCRAIVSECGYFSYFQEEIASAVQVPVFSSSLMQAPLARQSLGADKTVGILVAQAKYLTERHLRAVGIEQGSNYVIAGAMDSGACQEFDHLWTKGKRSDPPAAWYEKARDEFLSQAISFYDQHPNMGAMVLECTGFPPFAHALQHEIDIPIYSYGTLLDYAYSVVVHPDYYGYV